MKITSDILKLLISYTLFKKVFLKPSFYRTVLINNKFLGNLLKQIILFLFSLLSQASPLFSVDKISQGLELTKHKTVKILSIDGGGIRGLIPALILKELESKLRKKKHLAHCFNVIAGTSSGGIIALLLTARDLKKEPRYRAKDIVEIFKNLGSKVFNQSFWGYIRTLNGWIDERYSEKKLESFFLQYFNSSLLSESVTNIIIPAYDISREDTIVFTNTKAIRNNTFNFFIRDIARATTAAPTYFEPASIKDINHYKRYILVDGGVAALNNPTMLAWIQAISLYGKDNNFLILSLGTGVDYGNPIRKKFFKKLPTQSGGLINWVGEIIPVIMYAANDVVDHQLSEIFINNGIRREYYRFQVTLAPNHMDMDDASSENIKALESYAQKLINAHQEELSYIAKIIDEN